MPDAIIIGGTGFLGYHAGLELLKRGYQVRSLNLPDPHLDDWFPKQIRRKSGNLFEMNQQELIDSMKGSDSMVYSVGPDDRSMPRAPSYEYFSEKLVETSVRVFNAAAEAGVRKAVLLNSYFAYFHRERPDLQLGKRHSYIRARIEQAERILGAGNGMDVMVLELPYIFGTYPGEIPIWREIFLDRLLKFNPVFYPRGGSSMIRVEHVAEAIAGAIEHGIAGTRYHIGDVNMTWEEMFTIMFKAAGIKRRIVHLPLWTARIVGWFMQAWQRMNGREPGLNLRYIFQDIISHEFYLNPEHSVEELQYSRGGIVEAIEETARACFPEKNQRSMDK